jgi:D-alanyl-D-alanine carboxypeptidase
MNERSTLLTVIAMGLLAVCHAVSNGAEPEKTGPVIDKAHLLGHIDPATDANFCRVDVAYANREGLYLLDEVYGAFVRMHEAARKDGISLVIVSATRSFDAQKRIWEAKWTGARSVDGRNLAETVSDPIARARIILRYSSMPGTSRHHWGTDIDINSVEHAYFESPAGRKVYAWLAANAGDFGFCQTYSRKGNDRPRGYEEEPWHWSYCPIAKHYLKQYVQKVTYQDIRGFEGSETATRIDVITNYVLAINPKCLQHKDD